MIWNRIEGYSRAVKNGFVEYIMIWNWLGFIVLMGISAILFVMSMSATIKAEGQSELWTISCPILNVKDGMAITECTGPDGFKFDHEVKIPSANFDAITPRSGFAPKKLVLTCTGYQRDVTKEQYAKCVVGTE